VKTTLDAENNKNPMNLPEKYLYIWNFWENFKTKTTKTQYSKKSELGCLGRKTWGCI